MVEVNHRYEDVKMWRKGKEVRRQHVKKKTSIENDKTFVELKSLNRKWFRPFVQAHTCVVMMVCLCLNVWLLPFVFLSFYFCLQTISFLCLATHWTRHTYTYPTTQWIHLHEVNAFMPYCWQSHDSRLCKSNVILI